MLAVVIFAVGATVSVLTSRLLVSRLERIGERLGLSEVLLGIVAALAAVFVVSLIISGYGLPGATALKVGLGVLAVVPLSVSIAQGTRRGRRDTDSPRPRPLNGQKPAGGTVGDTASRRALLLPGWTARQLWVVSMIAAALVAAVDAATGNRVVLIGLLIVGPCLALLTGRWLPAAVTGVAAVAAATGAAMIDRVSQRPRSGPSER